MKFGSVCSGIEAASVAWHPLGWSAEWLAEIEPFPAAVLKHHYPEVANLGDMTKIATAVLSGDVAAPDVLVGGTPCQAFSVAGLRKSLDDERGQLSISFIHLADAIDAVRSVSGRPAAVVVWENVHGVLSTSDNAFGCFLAGLVGEDSELLPSGKKWSNAGCVYGPKRAAAWRVLDAQYFGVAQRRRRVFVVASAREGFDPAAVLFERDRVRRDSPPSREAGEAITPTIRAGSTNSSPGHGQRSGDSRDELIVPVRTFDFQSSGEYGTSPVAATLSARDFKSAKDLAVTHSLRGEGFDASEDGTGRGTPLVPVAFSIMPMNSGRDYKARETDIAQPIMAGGPVGGNQGGDFIAQPLAPVAFHSNAQACQLPTQDRDTSISDSLTCSQQAAVATFLQDDATPKTSTEIAGTLRREAGGEGACVQTAMQVRRLTPTECERLQGFPDGYTDIPWRKQPTSPDGPRYKALGNSMAVPVMRWIGKRIQEAINAD